MAGARSVALSGRGRTRLRSTRFDGDWVRCQRRGGSGRTQKPKRGTRVVRAQRQQSDGPGLRADRGSGPPTAPARPVGSPRPGPRRARRGDRMRHRPWRADAVPGVDRQVRSGHRANRTSSPGAGRGSPQPLPESYEQGPSPRPQGWSRRAVRRTRPPVCSASRVAASVNASAARSGPPLAQNPAHPLRREARDRRRAARTGCRRRRPSPGRPVGRPWCACGRRRRPRRRVGTASVPLSGLKRPVVEAGGRPAHAGAVTCPRPVTWPNRSTGSARRRRRTRATAQAPA